MEVGPNIRSVLLDPSALNWELPAAARRRLDAFAQIAGTDRLGQGKPLPQQDRLQILGELLAHLFPDGTTKHLLETAETLSRTQRKYLAALVQEARQALDKRQAEAPSTLLGFPPDTRGTWANLLGSGWIPWQPGWVGVRRS